MTSATDPFEKSDDNLAYRLFLQLISASYDSLSAALGPEEAKRAIRPYFENSGKAGYHNVVADLPISEAEKLLNYWLWANHGVTRSCVHGAFGPNKVVLEDYQCPLEGKIPEFCNGFCQVAAEAGAHEVWPECNFSQIPADDTNDHRCRWVAYRGSDGRSSDGLVQKEAISILRELPPDQFDWIAKAISGEVWVIATRALLDWLEEQEASTIILGRMSESGREFAIRHISSEPSEGDIGAISTFVQSIYSSQHQRGQVVASSPDSIAMEIHECPYADTPELLCREYEAFLNGACAQIAPDFEFKYERMMTRGDKYCAWSISRKKGEAEKAKDEEHPTMILMRRLAKGEISIKEYEELKAFISSELRDLRR